MRLQSLPGRLAIMAACGFASYGLRHQSLDMPEPYWQAMAAGMTLYCLGELVWPLRRHRSLFIHAAQTAFRFLLVGLVLATIAYVLKISESYSRLWSGSWLASTWLLICLSCLIAPSRPDRSRRLILVGEDALIRRCYTEERNDPSVDIMYFSLPQLLVWLDERDRAGDSLDGTEILLIGHVPEPADRTALVLALHGRAVALRHCADPLGVVSGERDSASSLLPLPGSAKDIPKRMEDVVLTLLLLGVLAPALLATAVLVRCSGPGPLLFRQRRLGLGGRAFTIYKFRTMVAAAADQTDAPQAEHNDSRITPVGVFLRRWGLDELPQLFNVLAGHMSLVGPRPHAFPHDMLWGAKLPLYAQRFRMRPGITGLAQISGQRGYADTIDDIAVRLEMDLDYIRKWSIRLDLAILFRTIPYMIFQNRSGDGPGAGGTQPDASRPLFTSANQ